MNCWSNLSLWHKCFVGNLKIGSEREVTCLLPEDFNSSV
jgi:hypothetical protein